MARLSWGGSATASVVGHVGFLVTHRRIKAVFIFLGQVANKPPPHSICAMGKSTKLTDSGIRWPCGYRRACPCAGRSAKDCRRWRPFMVQPRSRVSIIPLTEAPQRSKRKARGYRKEKSDFSILNSRNFLCVLCDFSFPGTGPNARFRFNSFAGDSGSVFNLGDI